MKLSAGLIAIFCMALANLLCAQESMTAAEKPILEQMIRELDYLTELADTAERSRNQALRFQIDYSALRSDIKTIREGLSGHLSAPGRSPRKIEPLKGSY